VRKSLPRTLKIIVTPFRKLIVSWSAAQRRTGSGESARRPVAVSMNHTGSAISASSWTVCDRRAGSPGRRRRGPVRSDPSAVTARINDDVSRELDNVLQPPLRADE